MLCIGAQRGNHFGSRKTIGSFNSKGHGNLP
jgi:hypothetical protein